MSRVQQVFLGGHISGAHILKPVGVLQKSMSVQEI